MGDFKITKQPKFNYRFRGENAFKNHGSLQGRQSEVYPRFEKKRKDPVYPTISLQLSASDLLDKNGRKREFYVMCSLHNYEDNRRCLSPHLLMQRDENKINYKFIFNRMDDDPADSLKKIWHLENYAIVNCNNFEKSLSQKSREIQGLNLAEFDFAKFKGELLTGNLKTVCLGFTIFEKNIDTNTYHLYKETIFSENICCGDALNMKYLANPRGKRAGGDAITIVGLFKFKPKSKSKFNYQVHMSHEPSDWQRTVNISEQYGTTIMFILPPGPTVENKEQIVVDVQVIEIPTGARSDPMKFVYENDTDQVIGRKRMREENEYPTSADTFDQPGNQTCFESNNYCYYTADVLNIVTFCNNCRHKHSGLAALCSSDNSTMGGQQNLSSLCQPNTTGNPPMATTSGFQMNMHQNNHIHFQAQCPSNSVNNANNNTGSLIQPKTTGNPPLATTSGLQMNNQNYLPAPFNSGNNATGGHQKPVTSAWSNNTSINSIIQSNQNIQNYLSAPCSNDNNAIVGHQSSCSYNNIDSAIQPYTSTTGNHNSAITSGLQLNTDPNNLHSHLTALCSSSANIAIDGHQYSFIIAGSNNNGEGSIQLNAASNTNFTQSLNENNLNNTQALPYTTTDQLIGGNNDSRRTSDVNPIRCEVRYNHAGELDIIFPHNPTNGSDQSNTANENLYYTTFGENADNDESLL